MHVEGIHRYNYHYDSIMLRMETAKNSNPTDLGATKDAGETCKETKKKERNTSSGWITKFRKRNGNEWLEEIDPDFLRDHTNFTGLDEEICYLSHGLHIIQSEGLYLDSNGNSQIRTKSEGKHLEAAEMLYSLVHARYMLTNKGLEKVFNKYKEGFYGSCPRYYCEKTKVLPIGMSDKFSHGDVKVYCPSCEDVYHSELPGNEHSDGACFGTSLPQMFFMAYPALHPSPTLGHYIPKAFGFKIHSSALHQHDETTELKIRQKCQTKHHRSKTSGKDKTKDSRKENGPSQDNTKAKLPDINAHCKMESTKHINGHLPEKTPKKRRQRKRTTEMKVQ